MFKRVKKTSSMSIGVRIAADIALAITSGRLKEGDMIPCGTLISSFFGLSSYEMSRIYYILIHHGWVYSIRSNTSRYFVAKGANKKNRHNFYITIADYLYDTVCEAKNGGLTEKDVHEIVRLTFEDQAPLYSELPPPIQAYIQRVYPPDEKRTEWL